jgi:serine/threonine-protein kinase
MFQVADPAVNRGEHLNANEILARGAARIDKDFAGDAAQRAALETVIGEVYSSLGDFPRAHVPLEAAVASWRSAGAAYEGATTLRALAWVNYRQGDWAAALKNLDEALPLLSGSTPRDAEELAQLHSYRALALQASAASDEALREFQIAYTYAERAGVANAVRGASIQNNLGLLLRERGDLPAAETALRLALVIYRRELGEDHFRSISTAQNLGLVLLDQNRLDEAQVLVDGASERIRAQYGENNADYATAMNTRGNVARRRGDSARALEIYAQSETAFRAALGDKHWYVTWPMFNSGLALLDQRDPAAALKTFDAVLTLRRATLDADNAAVAEGLQGRSEALFGLGRVDEALADAQQALTIDRAKLNSGNPELIHALWLIGHVQFLHGDAASAKRFWDEALASAAHTYGKDSPRFARLLKSTTNPAERVRDAAD